MNNEHLIMTLIMHGGDARAKSLQAIEHARKGDLHKAQTMMEHANKEIRQAHNAQKEIMNQRTHESTSLLMVHAQDHLMNALTVRDLSQQIINILKEQTHD